MFIIFLGASLFVSGQDLSFSQFYANRLGFNPAWTGVDMENRRVFLNYRNQWPGISNTNKTYVSYSASYDQFMDHMHGGFGFRINNDIQGEGALSQFSMSAMYSYHLWVNRNLTITAGFEATFVQRKLDATNFRFGDGIDPVTGNYNGGSEVYGKIKKDYPDFAVGFAGFYKNFYGGVSMAHLLKPNQTVSSDPNSHLPRRFVAFGGAIIPVYERRLGKKVLQLSPNMIYTQQKSFSQLTYGIEGIYQDQFITGILLRQNLGIQFSTLIFSAGYVTKNWGIRYSYDHQFSGPEIRLPELGAHEISMILTLNSEKKIKRQAIKCPKI